MNYIMKTGAIVGGDHFVDRGRHGFSVFQTIISVAEQAPQAILTIPTILVPSSSRCSTSQLQEEFE